MKRFIATTCLIALTSMQAGAQQITSAGDPALAGSTLVNFNALPNQSFTSMMFGNLTISSPGTLRLADQYSGQYGATGRYLDNNEGLTNVIRFTFAGGTSAFGMTWGAADTEASSLAAYDALNNLIYSYATPFNNVQNGYSDYIGIKAPDIAYAEITIRGGTGFDYILIDDVRFAQGQQSVVPEPASVALMATGLLGLIPAARRIRARRSTQA